MQRQRWNEAEDARHIGTKKNIHVIGVSYGQICTTLRGDLVVVVVDVVVSLVVVDVVVDELEL